MENINSLQFVNNYFYYMWNHWDYLTCKRIFGETLGEHIWSKWVTICNEEGGPTGGVAILWSRIDNDCRRKLVEAANEYYAPVSKDF